MKTIILCGGSGTRLWPLSRTTTPKQFAPLVNDKSLFEMTIERNAKICDEFIVVVNDLQLDSCISCLPKSCKSSIVIEPMARNTAPAIALACMNVDPEEVVLIVPSDHLIQADSIYYQCITRAGQLASENHLVTLELRPIIPKLDMDTLKQMVKTFSPLKKSLSWKLQNNM